MKLWSKTSSGPVFGFKCNNIRKPHSFDRGFRAYLSAASTPPAAGGVYMLGEDELPQINLAGLNASSNRKRYHRISFASAL
jgi:hypothetical protein